MNPSAIARAVLSSALIVVSGIVFVATLFGTLLYLLPLAGGLVIATLAAVSAYVGGRGVENEAVGFGDVASRYFSIQALLLLLSLGGLAAAVVYVMAFANAS